MYNPVRVVQKLNNYILLKRNPYRVDVITLTSPWSTIPKPPALAGQAVPGFDRPKQLSNQ